MAEKKSKSILHNLLSMTTAELLTRLASYFYFIYLTDTLGVEGWGLIATAIAFTEIFVSIISHGFDVYSISEISKSKSEAGKTVSPILTMKLFGGLLLYLVLAAAMLISEKPQLEVFAILIAGLHIFGRGISGKWVYQGLERMNVIAIRQVISSVFLVLMVYLFVDGYEDLLTAIWIQVGVEIFNTLWTFLYYKKEGYRLSLVFDSAILKRVLKAAIPFGAYFLLVSLYNTIDKNMIWFIREDFAYLNGILDSGVKISMIFMIPTIIIQNVFFPRFAHSSDKIKRAGTHKEYIRLMSLFMSIGMGVLLFIPEIYELILKENFSELEEVLPYYGLINLIIYSVLMFTIPLMAWGYQRSLLWATGAGAAANIIVNSLLIPVYGIYGALTATIFAELSVLAVAFYLFKREGIVLELRYPITAVLTSIVVFGGWSFLGISGINLIFVVMFLTAIQMLLLWLIKVVDKDLIKKLSNS